MGFDRIGGGLMVDLRWMVDLRETLWVYRGFKEFRRFAGGGGCSELSYY